MSKIGNITDKKSKCCNENTYKAPEYSPDMKDVKIIDVCLGCGCKTKTI